MKLNKYDLTDWANKEAWKEIEAAGKPRAELLGPSIYDPEVVWGLSLEELKAASDLWKKRLRRTPFWQVAKRRELKRVVFLWRSRSAAVSGCEVRWV